MSFLQDILEAKRIEVAELSSRRTSDDWKNQAAALPAGKDFHGVLAKPGLSVIAEIKKGSPSRGALKADIHPLHLAEEYLQGGASALSVLTDRRFFQGDPSFLRDVSLNSPLPVLRKDFILDEVQVYESKILGADAILLIARILSAEQLGRLFAAATELGMAVLVETHTEEEIRRANSLGATVIGVNNRDLDDFSVSLERSFHLRPLIQDGSVAVSESGIKTRDDAIRLAAAGYHAILVGEGLVESSDRVAMLRTLAAP